MNFVPYLKRIVAAWLGLGFAVANYQSRVVLGILYFSCVLPLGLLVRLVGERAAVGSTASYWVERAAAVDLHAEARRQF